MPNNYLFDEGSGRTAAAKDLGGDILAARIVPVLGVTDQVGGTGVDGAGVPRVTLATNVGLPAGTALIGSILPEGTKYEDITAGQTNQVCGGSGAAGDYLSHLLVLPATTAPGIVQVKDGSGTAKTLFPGGTNSISNLVPFMIPLGIKSVNGAWQVTTGANVSVLAVGTFT